MSPVFVGLGANLGDPRAQLIDAFAALDALPGTRVTGRSSFYRTAPVGYAAQPDFINAVVRLDTALEAGPLLQELQRVEQRQGRERSFANAPRTLDLDLLLYAGERIELPGLVVPHPRMHERAFVLAPLLELAPGAEIPGRGPAHEWLARCADQTIERIA